MFGGLHISYAKNRYISIIDTSIIGAKIGPEFKKLSSCL